MQWYKDPKTVSSYAGLVASIAALIVSVSAFRKKPDDTDTKGMYKVLVEAVERLSDESEQNRADLVTLRKYLYYYVKTQNDNLYPLPSISVSAPPHIDPPRQIVRVEPPKQINMDAGIPIAMNSSSPLDYDVNVGGSGVKKSAPPAPPVKLDREWKKQ